MIVLIIALVLLIVNELGWLSLYGYELDHQASVLDRDRALSFHHSYSVHTGSGDHPASYPLGSGCPFSGSKESIGVYDLPSVQCPSSEYKGALHKHPYIMAEGKVPELN
jgi:hypothetical protein